MTRPACVAGARGHQRRAVPRADVRPGRKRVVAGGTARHGQPDASLTSSAHGSAQARASSSTSTAPWSTRCPSHFVAWTEIAAATASTFPEERFYCAGRRPDREDRRDADRRGRADPRSRSRSRSRRSRCTTTAWRPAAASAPIAPVIDLARRHRSRGPAGDRLGQRAAAGDAHARARSASPTGSRAVVAAEDTARHKPEPDVFLEAARRLGVDPARLHRLRGHRHRPRGRAPRRHDTGRRAPADRRRRPLRPASRACSMPKNAAIFERSWFFCAALGHAASASAAPPSVDLPARQDVADDARPARASPGRSPGTLPCRRRSTRRRSSRPRSRCATRPSSATSRRRTARRPASRSPSTRRARRSARPPARRARRRASRPGSPWRRITSPGPKTTMAQPARQPIDLLGVERAEHVDARQRIDPPRVLLVELALHAVLVHLGDVDVPRRERDLHAGAVQRVPDGAAHVAVRSMSSRWTSSIQ